MFPRATPPQVIDTLYTLIAEAEAQGDSRVPGCACVIQ